jgi:hypothetical protein
MEGKEWVWDNGIIKEQEVNRLKLEMSNAKRHELAVKQAKVFESFIKNL